MQLLRAGLFILCLAPTAHAGPLPQPDGPVLLTIGGLIKDPNADDTIQFDLPMLEALGHSEIATSTIWTDGVHKFTGVPLDTLLAAVGAGGTTVRAQALNDYTVDVPVLDARPDGPIIAYAMDGQPMSVRDKGPLWLIYPYDAKAEYKTEVIYSRSIWQLDRMDILR